MIPVSAAVERNTKSAVGDEPMIRKELLDILACPACKGDIQYDEPNQKLICVGECKRRYPIRDGIPVMLIDEAELPESTA